MPEFRCRICGQTHPDLPLAFGAEAPDHWKPALQNTAGCRLTPDVCVIRDEYFFLRGNLEIPIIDMDQVFVWGVWVSVSRPNFDRSMDLWSREGRESAPPFFGWLSTSLQMYPDTLNLKTMVHTRPVGTAPFVELEPTDHPLSIEQCEGIPFSRVEEIAGLLLHPL